MRLTRVHVTGLLGIFNHEIPLNLKERITIIHGPNGFGKTIVLRMTAALLSGEYSLFLRIPFEKFIIEFDNGLCLFVNQRGGHELRGGERRSAEIDIGLFFRGEDKPISWSRSLMWAMDQRSAKSIKQLLSENLIEGRLRGFFVSLQEKPSRPLEKGHEAEPDWFLKARAEFPVVRLVQAQRLDAIRYDEDFDGERSVGPTVNEYSKDLALRIQKTLAEYASKSQEFDRSFPTRLLVQSVDAPPSAEELRRRLSELEQKRAELTQFGFLDSEPGFTPASSQAIEGKRDVLAVYVSDMQSKLSVFDAVAAKINLFVRIINARFLLKQLAINREYGFVFTSRTGARLLPSDLSSGEQHEVILFYELIFLLQENALVLVDEPEISLHVAWQEKFLEDLGEVVRLSGVDVVLATHSPEIIGNHWDWTVELKGPPELRQG